MTQRPITFSKTTARTWTNRETGVIIRAELGPAAGYRAMRPADVAGGYIGICQTVRTLAMARSYAVRHVADVARPAIAKAYDDAMDSEAQRIRDLVPTRSLGDSLAGDMFRASLLHRDNGDHARSIMFAKEALRYAVEADHAEALEDADVRAREAQTDAWMLRHVMQRTNASRDAYALIPYRLADHAAALIENAERDDTSYREAGVQTHTWLYRHGIEVSAEAGGEFVRRAIDIDHAAAMVEGELRRARLIAAL